MANVPLVKLISTINNEQNTSTVTLQRQEKERKHHPGSTEVVEFHCLLQELLFNDDHFLPEADNFLLFTFSYF